jgi:gluconolactonase
MHLDLTPVATGLRFPEGPVVMPDGSIILVEIEAGRITRVAPDGGKLVVSEIGGGPNGLAMGPGGTLFVCNNNGRFEYHDSNGLLIPGHAPPGHKGGMIQTVDLATGAVSTLYDSCDGKPLYAPNDIVFDRSGGFWFTDHGWADGEGTKFGGLYWARADGSRIVKATQLPTPNGVGLSPDERTVYAADTMTGRLWAYEITGEGEVAYGPIIGQKGRVVATMPGYQLFDSLAVEADGRVCVATIINGGITAIEPSGAFEHFAVPDLVTTNICFGGADMRDAWITASATGVLYKTRWPRPGLKLNFN